MVYTDLVLFFYYFFILHEFVCIGCRNQIKMIHSWYAMWGPHSEEEWKKETDLMSCVSFKCRLCLHLSYEITVRTSCHAFVISIKVTMNGRARAFSFSLESCRFWHSFSIISFRRMYAYASDKYVCINSKDETKKSKAKKNSFIEFYFVLLISFHLAAINIMFYYWIKNNTPPTNTEYASRQSPPLLSPIRSSPWLKDDGK